MAKCKATWEMFKYEKGADRLREIAHSLGELELGRSRGEKPWKSAGDQTTESEHKHTAWLSNKRRIREKMVASRRILKIKNLAIYVVSAPFLKPTPSRPQPLLLVPFENPWLTLLCTVSNLTLEIVQEFVAMSFLLSIFDPSLPFQHICMCGNRRSRPSLSRPFLAFFARFCIPLPIREAKIAVAAGFSSHGAQVEMYTVSVLPRPLTHSHTHTYRNALTHLPSASGRRSNYLRIC